jgi:hypothetical protein
MSADADIEKTSGKTGVVEAGDVALTGGKTLIATERCALDAGRLVEVTIGGPQVVPTGHLLGVADPGQRDVPGILITQLNLAAGAAVGVPSVADYSCRRS